MENFDFVAIDFETATNNRMACQVGIVVVENGEITKRICRLIRPPQNYYDQGPMRVHHITPDDTANEPTFKELWPEISEYFCSTTLVAHNAVFDADVLYKNLSYYGIDITGIGDFICTCNLYGKRSLEDLCLAFKIPVDHHHDALFDAECCAKFLLNHINGVRPRYSLIPVRGSREQKTLKGNILVKDLENADPNNPFYNKKVVITGNFCISRDELAVKLKEMGADINTTVSKKTDFVLTGADPGPSKMDKVDKLVADGYPIRKVFQNELLKILDGDYTSLQSDNTTDD